MKEWLPETALRYDSQKYARGGEIEGRLVQHLAQALVMPGATSDVRRAAWREVENAGQPMTTRQRTEMIEKLRMAGTPQEQVRMPNVLGVHMIADYLARDLTEKIREDAAREEQRRADQREAARMLDPQQPVFQSYSPTVLSRGPPPHPK